MLRLPIKSPQQPTPLPAAGPAFDPKKLREKLLADLTSALEKHMRSEAFLEWLRQALIATTHTQVLLSRKSVLHTISNVRGSLGGTSHAK
jgi:hypothetical protein